MKINKHHIVLSAVVLLIVAGIFYLESGKISPEGSRTAGDTIDIEEIILKSVSNGDSEENKNVRQESIDSGSVEELEQLRIAAIKRIEAKEQKFETAKEITTPDGFINSDTISISELIGKKVILIDFWTYSCINCQRTTPFLNSWYEKYADKGLVILGLHTPEFEFEKMYENVERAVRKFDIKYPVILDNDFSTWKSYRNRYWPRKYLIDIDGFIVYDHIGEGGYDETEEKIVELLNERSLILGERSVLRDMMQPQEIDKVDFTLVQSPETYLGSARIEYINNLPSRDCLSATCDYKASNDITLNTYQLDGRWTINPEESVLESGEGTIFIRFSASKVNLVAGANGNDVQAEIYLDGLLIDALNAGADVTDGVVTFRESDLYNLVDLKGKYGEHMLEIRFLDTDISVFAFTFG